MALAYTTPLPDYFGLYFAVYALIAFLGWGTLLIKSLKIVAPYMLVASAGCLVWIFLGSWGALFHFWTSITVQVLLAIGFATGLFTLWRERQTLNQSLLILAIPTTIWTIKIIAFMAVNKMNVHDDYHAYLPMVSKLLQTGSFENLQFLFRAPLQYGGQVVIESASFFKSNFANVLWMEPWAMGLLVLGVIKSIGQKLKWPTVVVLVAMLVYCFYPLDIANCSAAQSGVLFTLTFFFFLIEIAENKATKPNWRLFFLLGLVLGALATLKLYFLILSGLLGIFAAFSLRQNKMIPVVLAGVLLVVTPLAILSYKIHGTLLFPLFGLGHHLSAVDPHYKIVYWDFKHPMPGVQLWRLLTNTGVLASLFTAVVIFFMPAKNLLFKRSRIELLWILISSFLLLSVALTIKVNFYAFRYIHDLGAAYLAISLGFLFCAFLKYAGKKYWWRAAFPLLLVLAVFKMHKGMEDIFRGYLVNLPQRLEENPEVQSKVKNYQSQINFALASVPEKSNILAFVDKPFLMNFKKHNIYFTDSGAAIGLPGTVGPSNSIESFRSRYVKAGIDYILYAHKTEANFPRSEFTSYLTYPIREIQIYSELIFKFQDRINQLADTDHLFYKDSQFLIIKL